MRGLHTRNYIAPRDNEALKPLIDSERQAVVKFFALLA